MRNKIIKELTRPFRQLAKIIYRHTWGLLKEQYRYRNRHRMYRNLIFTANDKVYLPNVDFQVAHSCNLKCEHCSAHSPFRKGLVSKEVLFHLFEGWSQKIEPTEVRLVGGEPLLHPDFAEIVSKARTIWKNSQITIFTNGVLLPKVTDNILWNLGKLGGGGG